MYLLGISAYYHDAAAALLHDGHLVAAAQEERFTRKKHDASFPASAVAYCLEEGGIGIEEVEAVVFYDKPLLTFERLLETYLSEAPRGLRGFLAAMPVWIKEKLYLKTTLARELCTLYERSAERPSKRQRKAFKRALGGRILFGEHHMSHAASAFYPSPFEAAAIITIDGVGEWTTASVAYGSGSTIELREEIRFPHSLGLLYSAFTYYLGFKVNSGEYKVMGLAPYGEPRYADRIREHLIDIKEDGSFRLDMRYFNYTTGLTMTSKHFDALFGGAPRTPESSLTQRHMDLAASLQAVTEEVMLKIAQHAAESTGSRHLCMAGGVALNCVGNGKIARADLFDQIWIQPAAGDAGSAVGAAYCAYHMEFGHARVTESGTDSMQGAFLGPAYGESAIEASLDTLGAVYRRLDEAAMLETTARALAEAKVVGWHQGRMEFGPRALGHRSILADPRDSQMQKTLNLKIKFRESFRPFAPAVLQEHAFEWFDLDFESPYMLFTAEVHTHKRLAVPQRADTTNGFAALREVRSLIPAVTHVDYSARVQTVSRHTNPVFHRLLLRFYTLTGCPVLINTSFNVRGEPIVCTPADSYRCFMRTEMDLLVIGNFVLYKEEQPEANATEANTAAFMPD